MTEKLYDRDAYLRAFTARVLSCAADGDRFRVTLDRTAFFPEGGGQYADRGTLGSANVLDVQITDGEIVHFTDAALPVGDTARGELDFGLRFRRMQNHTGEHIVSGVVHRLFGYDNVGFHLGDGDVTVDYNGELTREDLDRVETLSNEAVWRNLEVRAEYPDPVILDTLTYRSKLELTENVRIVTIGDVDCCACCAPHVARTGEIGSIKILDFERYKGGVRLHMLCGADAMEDYRNKYASVHTISLALRVPQSETAPGVQRLQKTLEDKEYEITGLRRLLALSALDAAVEQGSALCFFASEGVDMDALRFAVNRGMERAALCAGFCPTDQGYRYCIGSAEIDLRAASKTINAGIGGRGGGQAAMIQGTATAEAETIRAFFASFLPPAVS